MKSFKNNLMILVLALGLSAASTQSFGGQLQDFICQDAKCEDGAQKVLVILGSGIVVLVLAKLIAKATGANPQPMTDAEWQRYAESL